MSSRTPGDRRLHTWSPLNDKSVLDKLDNGHGDADCVRVRVRLAAMDSEGDITGEDREDSTDLLIGNNVKHLGTPDTILSHYITSGFVSKIIHHSAPL